MGDAAEIEELATRMKLMGCPNLSDSASDFSWESGGGKSIRFSSSAASEDEDANEASPPLPSGISECDMMKERFAKLLLGEDMSGCGKGVSTALAISNGITNLFASIYGQLWRPEPLPIEKKKMWRRELDFFLSVCDHIVEMVPSYKAFPDGTKLEIMTCRPRSDLFINLPALRKLDSMLLELLDGFSDAEFCYDADHGKIDVDTDGSAFSNKALARQQEKWWLPVPRTPIGGFSVDSMRQLHLKRECCYQILKAAMTINTATISDMEVPDSYLESLPKMGRACLGESLFRFMASDHFSVESLFHSLELSADDVVLELVNRLEAAIYVWHNRSQSNLRLASSFSAVKSSLVEAERRELVAGRAEDLLLTLKQKFPNLPQTTLEATKIQCNKDVGKSILESYSRVLESLAYNIIARIDDLLSMDKLRHQTTPSPDSLALSHNPTRTAPVTPCLSASPFLSPSMSEIVPFRSRLPRHGGRAKRVLASYLCVEPHSKRCDSPKKDSSVQ